jgi:hypothetical protein
LLDNGCPHDDRAPRHLSLARRSASSLSMTPRHAAALALVGWYLMRPPGPNNGAPDFRAPLSQWTYSGSFDSAKDCQRERDSRIDLGVKTIHDIRETVDGLTRQQAVLGKDRLQTLREDAGEAQTFWLQYTASQCIATDDPRLKQK